MDPYDHPHFYHLQNEAKRRAKHRYVRPKRRVLAGWLTSLRSARARLALPRSPAPTATEATRRLAPVPPVILPPQR
jgi:hypothetical protein